MSDSMLVRASREGDQFHYLWAARRALHLLSSQSDLVAISIEGATKKETDTSSQRVSEGEEVIDIAEYYGSESLSETRLVRYMQLKHSTVRTDELWQPSGLEGTISGFASRFSALQKQLIGTDIKARVEFCFITNRPINAGFIETIEEVAKGKAPQSPTNLTKLKNFTNLDGPELAEFCATLRFEGRQDGYWDQRNILFQDIAGYLPDLDMDAPLRLKELVLRKALPESVGNPAITKLDVLRALGTDETALFPAPCLIEQVKKAIPREQEPELLLHIVKAQNTAIIVHADSGVGKSIFSTRIALGLPPGSVSILYDCFGNGQYRSATGYRHRHRVALVQMANELSARGLCHPLIPTAHADASAFMKAFIYRIRQSISIIQRQNSEALLCLIIDAADNAQMAAEELNEARSFIRDLVREPLPEGVRLVALCRPYREALLNPPPNALSLGLSPFSRNETAIHLRGKFPEATEHDVTEFHRLSSCNPRVQALALSKNGPLPNILRLLGPNPTTVESAIGEILQGSIKVLRDTAGPVGEEQIDLICAGLAALRPFIPIAILSEMSGVSQAAIKSFAIDLGRPLIVTGDAVQFFDEPAETWFREKYRPSGLNLAQFLARLKPLAVSSAYVASALPQLMLEAGEFDALVNLALTSQGLPETNPVERRDVELQRLQFALKAALRTQRYVPAAKLALKAGGETAGSDRQNALLRDNSDLAAAFFDSTGIQELVSKRTFGSKWIGSQHAHEAAVMAMQSELMGEARSRLRMAEEWLRNWSRMSQPEREKEPISDGDRAVMAMAHYYIHGAGEAAYFLRRWKPRHLSYDAGRIVARRFLDHGNYLAVDELALAAGNDIGLVLAIAEEARSHFRPIPKEATERSLKLLQRCLTQRKNQRDKDDPSILAVTSLIEIAFKQGLCDINLARDILKTCLPPAPPRDMSYKHGGARGDYLRLYALCAVAGGEELTLKDLAPPELREEMENRKEHSASSELREFTDDVGSLLPWHLLWARAFFKKITKSELDEAIAAAIQSSSRVESHRYNEPSLITNEIAHRWIEVLFDSDTADSAGVLKILEWSKGLKRPLFTPTLNRMARLCAQTDGLAQTAIECAQAAFKLLRDERSDAGSKAEGYVEVARSVLVLSKSEAGAYFENAVEVASKIGDENLARWDALIDLSLRSSRPDRPAPEIAYKFARCAEVTWDFVVRDKHFAWEDTVTALASLCPSSAFAIISRWRDRRFGDEQRILAAAAGALADHPNINPLDLIPLVGFQAVRDEPKLIKRALTHCKSQESKADLLGMVYRYMSLASQSPDTWRHMEALAAEVGVALPELAERVTESEAGVERRRKVESRQNRFGAAEKEASPIIWSEIFQECDLTTPVGISSALERFRAQPNRLYHHEFEQQLIAHVPIGQEPEFLQAFGAVDEFSTYTLRTLLEVFPTHWKDRPAIRASLAKVISIFCQKNYTKIDKNRYYSMLPFKLASDLSGLSEAKIARFVIDAVGNSTELSEASRLFSLVGLLSESISSDEALEALSYGLDLFESVLEEKDGDGPWRLELSPPASTVDALAGYIWAGLASPVGAIRWEAAHAIHLNCRLGREEVLRSLMNHLRANTRSPFGDRRLLFYSFHAKQWLLIALARASLDHGSILVPYAADFLEFTKANQLHVIFRQLASQILLNLSEQCLVSLVPGEFERLEKINTSTLPPRHRDAPQPHQKLKGQEPDLPEGDRYLFGMDFGPYVLAPLGRCFGLTEPEIEYHTLQAVRGDMAFSGSNRWSDDRRQELKLYRYEDTNCHHGTTPRVDDQAYYVSYHAMMITAGRLLTQQPLIEASDEWEEERFANWIAGHSITRQDGRWLADRRDPVPLGLDLDDDPEEWLYSVAAEDFEHALVLTANFLVVWGYWSKSNTSREEECYVRSALVSPERSKYLLSALQTVHNPHDFRLPHAEDDSGVDHGLYQLRGWIGDGSHSSGIDEGDPWAAKVRFPAPEPASFVVEEMQLYTDIDRRMWKTTKTSEVAFQSQMWGHAGDDDDNGLPEGQRLLGETKSLIEFLRVSNWDLIIEVEIKRRNRRQRYGMKSQDELETISPSTRIFLIKGDGSIRSI